MVVAKVLGLMFVFFAIAVTIAYGTASFGAVEQSADVTNSTYYDAYNVSSDAAQVGMSLLQWLGVLAAAGGVGVVLLWIAKEWF